MKRISLVGVVCVCVMTVSACVQGEAPRVCSVASASDAAQLGFRELHTFGKNYEVFQLIVKLDGCVLFQSEDTSVLDRPQFELPPRAVAAGSHEIEIYTKFRSGFSADMHDYEWIDVRKLDLSLNPNSTSTLVIRRSEVEDRDPRKRMQSDAALE